MTSRERVRLSLNHQQPDRVPIDLWGSASRIITQQYLSMMEIEGITQLGSLERPGTTTQYVDYSLADRLHSDFRHINIKKPDGFQSYVDDEGNRIDEWGIGRKLTGGYNAITYHPLKDLSIQTIQNHPWPTPKDPGRIRGLAQQAKDWYENTNYAITATSAVSGNIFENCQYLCGAENFLMSLYDDEDFVFALVDKLTEIITEWYLYYLEPIAPYIEWIEFTEDYASQHSMFISPATYRKFFKNAHRQIFSAIKNRFPNLRIWFHSCGAVRPIIPDLIEAGVDILNPLQPCSPDMDAATLKKDFGNQVVLHGGVDIQFALPGTLEEVEKEAKRCIDAFSAGGGYIFAPTNHIQTDVPPENVYKLFNTAYSYGKYPIG